MRPLKFALGGLAILVECAIAIALVFSSNHESHPWRIAPFAVVAGLSFVAAGLVALWRRPDNATGFLLAATGYLWFLAALNESNNGWVATVGFVFSNLAFVAFAALILAYPDGRLTRRDIAIVGIAGIAAIGANLIDALIERHFRGCPSCPRSAIAVTDLPGAAKATAIFATAIVVVALGLIVVILVARWRRSSAAQRRVLTPVYVTAGLSLSLLLIAAAIEHVTQTGYSIIWLGFLVSFLAVPLAFLAGVLRSRFDRAPVADMVLALEGGAPLRNVLAAALRDPSLEIVYWLEGPAHWVDADGRQVTEPIESPDRSVTMVERHGKRIAALIHDPALDESRAVIDSTAAAAGLALENERLHADLRAQYRFLETVAVTAPSQLVVIDLDGRIRLQNRAVVEASGLDEEKIHGQYFWDVFIDVDEREAVRGRFASAAPDHPPAEYENTFVNARGERRVIAWRSAPVIDETGRVESIVAGGIDITERKHRELEAQREHDFLNTLADTTSSVIALVDTKGLVVPPGVNAAFRKTIGLSDADLLGKSLLEVIETADRAAALETIAVAGAGDVSPEVESTWIRHDGGRVVMVWAATPIMDSGGRHLVLITGRDVTERKQQEIEIRASRARIVAAGDEARRRLERNLHDGAQQRLVALSLALRLAQSKLSTDPEAAAAILNGASNELALALDELRELARGIHPAVLTDRGLAAALEALAARTPLPIELTTPEGDLPEQIEAAVYYVVSESLANVVKYAQATVVHVRVSADDGRAVQVEVADDGIGGADPGAGSGLRGLADRVAAFDGRLEVESPPRGGTRIVAEIPLLRPALPA